MDALHLGGGCMAAIDGDHRHPRRFRDKGAHHDAVLAPMHAEMGEGIAAVAFYDGPDGAWRNQWFRAQAFLPSRRNSALRWT